MLIESENYCRVMLKNILDNNSRKYLKEERNIDR